MSVIVAARVVAAEVRLALWIAYASRWAYLVAVVAAAAMGVLLIWSGGFVEYFPGTGWEFDAGLTDRLTIALVAILFGHGEGSGFSDSGFRKCRGFGGSFCWTLNPKP